MIITDVRVKYTGPVPGSANLGQREFNALVREAWRECGNFWHQYFRPKHFTQAGAKEYAYNLRTANYMISKADRKGHQAPLVWSGGLRNFCKAFRVEVTAKSSGSQCRVILPDASGANRRHPNSNIDMRDELTRVSDAEREAIVELFNEILDEKLGVEAQRYTSIVQVFHEG